VSGPLRIWRVIHNWVITQNAFISVGVVMGWMLLAFSGRCRPERSWVDRVGLLLGILWIIAALASWLVSEDYLLRLGIPPPTPPVFPTE
jgi:hypothetical protein